MKIFFQSRIDLEFFVKYLLEYKKQFAMTSINFNEEERSNYINKVLNFRILDQISQNKQITQKNIKLQLRIFEFIQKQILIFRNQSFSHLLFYQKNKILNTIDKLDIFGVPISFLTNAKTSLQQSRLGGLITFLIGSISLTYYLFLFILLIDHQIPPVVNFKQQTISYAEYQLSDSIIQLEFQDFLGGVDPFRKKIISSLLNYIELLIQLSIDKPSKILINDGTFVLNNGNTGNDENLDMKQLLLVLEGCSNLTTVSGSYCADENVITEYLSKFHGFLFLTIYLNQFQRQIRIKKQYYTALEPSKPLYSQVMLKQQESIIDDGILFNNYQNYQFLNNYELIHQQVDHFFTSQVVVQIFKSNFNVGNPIKQQQQFT
ncbi:unnamed protein product [Paramecium pentaurelia]|uniref:Transmembrane protein n=1 Tax=Paramecium pentaurelia TaxID=43138 RepID=A0A8S1XEG4_9CILI|nr:unnamed protein product [Paramecium pentaurelia]